MRSFEEILKIVCDYLNQKKVEYVIVEGVAVMYYGVPRTTVDIDFLIKMDTAGIHQFVEILQSNDFDINEKDFVDAFESDSHCAVFDNQSLIRLDIQGIISEFDELTLNRAVVVAHLGIDMKLATAEDTIVNKVLFESEQDIRDALGIYVRHSDNLDYDYILSTCKVMGINEKWDSFLKESSRKLDDNN
ncbi:MAG: nucleotidyltransferase [Candidatus Thorarchaeota archaeon]